MCEWQKLNIWEAKGLDKSWPLSCCLWEYNYYSSVQGDVTQTTDDRSVSESADAKNSSADFTLLIVHCVFRVLIVLSQCMQIIFQMVCRGGDDLMQLWKSEIMFRFSKEATWSGNSVAKAPLNACRGLAFPRNTCTQAHRDQGNPDLLSKTLDIWECLCVCLCSWHRFEMNVYVLNYKKCGSANEWIKPYICVLWRKMAVVHAKFAATLAVDEWLLGCSGWLLWHF